MLEEQNPDITQAQQLILSLNEARQKEIEAVRNRMEDFLKGQIELSHRMELVANKQDALKERFEEGVSKRLTNLDAKFDRLLIEWGEKKKDDQLRDERINDIKTANGSTMKKAEEAIEAAAFYGKWILVSVLGGLGLGAIVFVFETLKK